MPHVNHLGNAGSRGVVGDGHDAFIGGQRAFMAGARGILPDYLCRLFSTLSEPLNKKPALYTGTGSKYGIAANFSSTPTTAQLQASLQANDGWCVSGTNMTSALCQWAGGTGLGAKCGISLNTAGADADQAILKPLIVEATNAARATTTASITTAVAHNLYVGQVVTVNLLTGPAGFAALNGTYVVTALTSSTIFTYTTVTTGTVTTGAATGTVHPDWSQWSQPFLRSDGSVRFRATIRTGRPAAISNLALTSNVVTVTTATNHNLSIGQTVTVAMLTGPTLFADVNGTFIVASIPTATTFTYAFTHANISTGAATGTLTVAPIKFYGTQAINNLALTSNVVTLTTAATHFFAVGDRVTVTLLTGTSFADLNGSFVVTAATTNTFSYALVHQDISTIAATGSATATRAPGSAVCNVLLQTIWVGLKQTETSVYATDNDQFMVRFLATENNGYLQVITSRGGVDKVTVIPIQDQQYPFVMPNMVYDFVFTIDANRNPSLRVNGNEYDLQTGDGIQTGDIGSAALSTNTIFIPIIATSANGTTPGTKQIEVAPDIFAQNILAA